jgi:hypothetical protein
MRIPALVVLASAVALLPATAQHLPPAPARYVAAFRQPPDTQGLASTTQTQAWEGAKVGGAILGLGGIGLAYGLCSEGDNGHPTTFSYCAPRSLIGGLIGATLGAVIGGFIGSAFPRTHSP